MQILNLSQLEKLDDAGLLKYAQFVGVNARKWKNHFIATLPEIARRGIYKKKFATITEFAAKVGGVGRKTVEAVFQVEKKLEDKPVLKELIPEVGINKVRVVAAVATQENQKELAEKVKTMSKGALEEVARSIKNNEPESKTLFSQIPPERNLENEREYFGFRVDKKTALEFRKFKLKIEKKKKQKVDFNEVFGELLEIVKEEPKNVRVRNVKPANSRNISAAKKRETDAKYQGCCAFPGCNKPAVHLHHPDRWALEKNHKRIFPLCEIHHELAHRGLIGNEEKQPHQWFIRKLADKTHPKYKIDKKVIGFRVLAKAIPA